MTLQVPGDVPAVLNREPPLGVKLSSPSNQPLEPGRSGLDRELGEHLARRSVDREAWRRYVEIQRT